MTRRLLARGGDRRTGDALRVSDQLTEAQCRSILAAIELAWLDGRPFNRFVTLLWEHGGIDARLNAQTTRRWLHHAQGFLRQHGEHLAHCWVQEWGSRKGAHVHALLHIPPRLDPLFRSKPLHWTKLCLPGKYVSGTTQCQRIAASRDPEDNAAAYRAALMGKVHYMLKYAPAELEALLDMNIWRSPWSKSWGRTGMTIGSRIGRWQHRKT